MSKKNILTPWPKTGERQFKIGHRTIITRTFVLPDGRSVDFELMRAGDIVCILPLTTAHRVVLAKQFRPGPEQIVLELPGGLCEPGEDPADAARRELVEETGYAGILQLVNTSLLGAYTVGQRYNFVATDCRRIQAQQLDLNEFIEPVEMSFDEFMLHLRSGQLSDVTTGFLGLDFLGLL
ncbi:NUDIX hydrolase [Patescibacteria group bacterium]|nr:NUDIX hydrolase [Patescibacteria group bacterium]MBU1028886.1 NUDIX hydrolase [Patescibacteria group bacterium]MBU1915622.1 NUDIX hydrolase [Patescibacteria group bacterium]